MTDKPIYVDANTAWTPKEAVRKIRELARYGVELVEQPTKPDDLAGLSLVREHSELPIIADESVKRTSDIPILAECVDGINIKLVKCGGLLEAHRMISVARAHGLRVMLGLYDREFPRHHRCRALNTACRLRRSGWQSAHCERSLHRCNP